MKRILILTAALLLTTAAAVAQKYTPNTRWPYVYEEFLRGHIYYEDKDTKSQGLMNIHLWACDLHFVGEDGRIYQAGDDEIVRVEIGNDAYLYGNHKLMRIIAARNKTVLVALPKADFESLMSGTGAYGASLNTYGKTELANLDLGGLGQPDYGKTVLEKSEGRDIDVKDVYYIIMDGLLVEANRKAVTRALPEASRKDFETFLSTHKIKWKSVEGLTQMLDFFQ